MGRKPSGHRHRRLFRAAAVASGLIGLGLIVSASFYGSLAIPFAVLRLEAEAVGMLGLIVIALSGVCYLFPTPVSMSLFFLTATGALALVLAAHPPRRGERDWSPTQMFGLQRIWTSSTEWYEPYTRKDPLYGSIGIPGQVAHAHHRDFDVRYTIGPDGFRVMPMGPKGAPEIVIIGCSFTFGIGVDDDQTYSALLARDAWPNYRVLNWSFSGWGTNHACLAVEEALKLKPKPALILYGFFFGHLIRNDLRQSWHRSTRARFPLFDEKGNHLGLTSPWKADKPDSPELDQREREVTRALLLRMKRACDQAGVPFAVLFLRDGHEESVRDVLDIPGLAVLDVTEAYNESFPNDGHPTPLCHKRIARAVATSPLLAELSGRTDLRRGDAFPVVFPEEKVFRLVSWRDDDELHHRGAHVDATADSFRVDQIKNYGDVLSNLQMSRPIMQVQKGEHVRLRFRARADKERKIAVEPRATARPWEFWASGGVVHLGPEEKPFRFDLIAKESLTEPLISFGFGDDDTPFAVNEITVSKYDPAEYEGFHVAYHPPTEANFAELTKVEGMEGTFRVDTIECAEPMPWKIQLLKPAMEVSRDALYRVRGWIRSDQPKKVFATILADPPIGEPIGEFRQIDVTPEWTYFDVMLRAKKDAKRSMLSLQLGEDTTPIEFHSLTIENPTG